MTITRISKQKKRSDRYNVYIDELYSFSISANDLLKSKISVREEVSIEELEIYKRQASKNYLLDACLNYISSRPHSSNEVSQYIKKKIFLKPEIKEHIGENQKEVISEILHYLQQKNYVNDLEFATWLTSQRNNGRSPKSFSHIKAELKSKGISSEIIEGISKDINITDESAKIQSLLGKKLQQLKNRNKNIHETRKALYTHLLQKGFSWEDIQPIVDTYIEHQYNID
ncbi:hypothetical protein CO058_02905 [candidate division WWE3 bacterium CG_4_9_14_0_2_um_filter_35_11]|uniref:Regulatory protein RecX n=1 Tax=candidate division WWE3 bacterium CG_4_9_14_0_2_um_filter_35_11 TaxID=1975077 RepID=A0A2M8ELC4_UNCKA|nr:MAG: hypothetical protein COV25_01835 [candidate division WWE3 bacterium CG10_big_fil_rev_8_21_14_0_10_35_32]PJC23531.1 MAG: hypothetical protein CO058_02905 [candidate division WWE3 bacterium CG_4_9_14_0_2_um_filter_35_11]